MPFRSLIISNTSIDIPYFTNGANHVVTINLAVDDAADLTLSLLATLTPTPWMGQHVMEFAFCVVEYDGQTDTETRYWSGLDTNTKLVGDDRPKTLHALDKAVRILLSRVLPRQVFIQSCEGPLPPKAHFKYEIVLRAFRDCGYQIEAQPLYHGRPSWWLECMEP